MSRKQMKCETRTKNEKIPKCARGAARKLLNLHKIAENLACSAITTQCQTERGSEGVWKMKNEKWRGKWKGWWL